MPLLYRSFASVQDFDLRAKIKLLLIHQAAKTIVYILHGGDKLYPAVAAVQALFLVEFVIVFF